MTERAPGQQAPAESSWQAPALIGLGGLVGAADLWLGYAGWRSAIPTGASSLLALPWALLFWRSAGARGSWRVALFQLAIISLLLALLGAKWLAFWQGLGEGERLARSYRTYTSLALVVFVAGMLLRGGRAARVVAQSAEHPARLMALSFASAAALGSLLLALPISLRRISDASVVDSLFMAMSAVSVTGLSSVNVADTYSFTGQLVLVLLMQIGGLGIMVLTAAVTLLAGRRLDVRRSAVLTEMIDAESLGDLRRTIQLIVGTTFAVEALGALLLYLAFRGIPASELAPGAAGGFAGAESAWWAAIFHAVSAFCNGSLSNFRDGLSPFSRSPVTCQTVALLIVIGGLGFPVVRELLTRAGARLRRRRAPRMSLHSRIALSTTAVLLALMAVAYLALERSASFAELPFAEQVNAAVFQSACARTSGFNLVDVSAMRPATLLLTCFAMFVGGDPGSTAGGIKTTTIAVLFAAYRGELRGTRPRLFDRAIPEAMVRRATGVAFLGVVLLALVVFLLMLSERHEPLQLIFEAVSAFSTTGLSTGITAKLSIFGKALLIATMLVGRIGPLTVALALSARARLPAYELPEERVMIG